VARTTSAAVALLIEVDEDISLTPFIETANALVTEVCEDNEDADYDATRLELIERWLSAHFYAVRDPRAASETAGRVNARYQYKVDLNLAVTTYGQQAMLLDTAGGLARLNRETVNGTRRRAGVISWLGTTTAET
jgi:hypothetical protein